MRKRSVQRHTDAGACFALSRQKNLHEAVLKISFTAFRNDAILRNLQYPRMKGKRK